MKFPRFHSLAFRIVAVASVCVSTVLCAAIVVIVIMIGDLMRDDLGTRTQQTLNYNYQLVRLQIHRARLTLEALAEDPSIPGIFANTKDTVLKGALSAKFDGAITLVEFLENIALQKTTCEILVADEGYTRQTFYNFFSSDYCGTIGRESESYVSSVFRSTTTYRSVVMIAVPIYGEGSLKLGQISAIVDVGDLSTYLTNIQENDSFTVVLDRYGYAIVDTRQGNNEQRAVLENDPIITKVWKLVSSKVYNGFFEDNIDDMDVVVGFHQYTGEPGSFTVLNVEPKSLSYQLQRQIVIILSSVGVLMLFSLIIALWFTMRWSTRRLQRMTETIVRIAKGNEHARLPKEMFSSQDEVGVLGQSFNKMIDHIDEAHTVLEDDRAKSEAILLGIGDGVMAMNSEGKVILFNKAAEEISGYSARFVIGKHYTETMKFMLGEGDSAFFEEKFIQQALAGSLAVMPDGMSLVRNDGIKVPVADSSAPIINAEGNVVGAVIVFRDVTHEREVDRLKSEFVSVASHQLRTPLTAIRWNLEDLQSEETGALGAEQKENVKQAATSTGRMIRLVNDLLDVSRLESGRLSVNPAPTDIAEMLTDIVREDRDIARDKSCVVNLHLPEVPLAPINIDPTLIRQVAANLISNSIQYGCSAKRSPTVDVTLSQDGKEYYRVTITDNGMGIAKKDEDRIFQRFFRADNGVKQQTEGSGLGLYIAKLIVEESGGMISFSSKEGEGSTFWFLLPISGSKERRNGKTLTAHE